MNNQLVPILLDLLAALIGAGGQYFYKIGAGRLGKVSIFQNWQILVGMILFTGVMICFIAAFKMGGRLSVVYPIYATTFIWGTLIGIKIENEPWSITQLIGIGIIVLGTSIVAIYSPAQA